MTHITVRNTSSAKNASSKGIQPTLGCREGLLEKGPTVGGMVKRKRRFPAEEIKCVKNAE